MKWIAIFLALSTPAAAGQGAEPLSEWTSYTQVSKMADTTDVFLRTLSKNQIRDKFDKIYIPRLLITCFENSTNIYVDFNGLFVAESSSFGEVTYRIDKEKAQTTKFRASTNNRSLGLWDGDGIPLIKRLISKSQFLVRATPVNESPVDIEFSLIGFDAELPALRKACSW